MTDQRRKLYKRKHWFLLVIFAAVPCLHLWREYHMTGSVSGGTIGAAVFAMIVATIIFAVIYWHGNRPEQVEDER